MLCRVERNGRLRLKVVEGYRCPRRNREVKGPAQSEHMFGRAALIKSENLTGEFLRGFFEALVKSKAIVAGGLATSSSAPDLLYYDIRSSGPARWQQDAFPC